LNHPDRTRVAGNKYNTFQAFNKAMVPTLQYTNHPAIAQQWLDRGHTVVARRSLTGHSGAGIEILTEGLDFVLAPLYTIYVPKTAEYRIHVMKGEVIDVQRKIKDPDREVIDWKVRSHQNGFIFVRNNDKGESYRNTIEPACIKAALLAVQALGLDFGGVDVIYSNKTRVATVLEVNCACGLEGATVESYAKGFKKLF
jgi:glutathione synthase/RimK-type ligase-like ATP-grasp enzyme